MKFNINKEDFQSTLEIVAKGAAVRSTLPILSGIHCITEGDMLTLEATNLDLSIKRSIPAFIEEEGEAVIPSKLLTDVVKSLPEAAVHVETTTETASIMCESSSFSLKTLDPQDFPGFPEVEQTLAISIPFSTFSHMVKRVARVVSRDESRAILTGVLLEVHDGMLRMVATDSYRLAVTDIDFTTPSEDFTAVISGSFMSDLAGLSDTGESLTLALAENQIVVTYDGTTFINRRIEGNYPRYSQLIPETYETCAIFDTKMLIEAVKRTSLLSNKTAPVRFDVNKASQTVQISTASQDVGEAHETLGAKIQGEDEEIAFNFGYVIDGLSSIETESVQLELQGSMKPGILRATEQENFLYLIMPVRLS